LSQLEDRSKGSEHTSLGLKYTTHPFDGEKRFRVAAGWTEEFTKGGEFQAEMAGNWFNLRTPAAQPFTMASMHQVEKDQLPAVS
jgi:hypothetical protein